MTISFETLFYCESMCIATFLLITLMELNMWSVETCD